MTLASETNVDAPSRRIFSPDGETIQRSLDDPSAFAAVFDLHFDSIYRYISRRTGTTHAEDLASETFTRAFARRASYVDSTAGARPWLFGIATKLLSEARRTETRRLRAYARAGSLGTPTPGNDDLIARLDGARNGRQLAALLRGLNRVDRDILLLTAIGELSNAEVAAVVGIPVGTVASKLNRIRARLQHEMNVTGEADG